MTPREVEMVLAGSLINLVRQKGLECPMSLATCCPCTGARGKLVVQVDELLHGCYDLPAPPYEQRS